MLAPRNTSELTKFAAFSVEITGAIARERVPIVNAVASPARRTGADRNAVYTLVIVQTISYFHLQTHITRFLSTAAQCFVTRTEFKLFITEPTGCRARALMAATLSSVVHYRMNTNTSFTCK